MGRMAAGGKMSSMKKLPLAVGYRLNPSDEDVVYHHLERKLQNIQEDYCLIPEFDIYKLPPWDLITKFNELSDLASDGRECFFYHRRTNPNSKRNNRKTKEGFWKVTGEGRKPRDTDRIKWLKRILVFHTGKQKSADKSEWAMHEWENPSNKSIVVCRIHKIKPKKGKVKLDSVSSEAGSKCSPGTTAFSEIQIEQQETSPEASVNTAMDSQNLTPTTNINLPEYSSFCPQQTQIVAAERLSHSKDIYTDSIQLADLEDPQDPPSLMREQSPCSDNTSVDGYDQGDGSWSYSGDVTPEENVNMSMSCETPTDQSLDYVLPQSVSPPQHPNVMPTGEISHFIVMPTGEISHFIGTTSSNGIGSGSGSGSNSGSVMINPRSDIHGHGAQCPFISVKYGAEETNFKAILSREQSPCSENNFIPGSDQEDGRWLYHGDVDLEKGMSMSCHTRTGQSLNDALLAFVSTSQETRDSAAESPDETDDPDSWLNFLVDSPPQCTGGTFENCDPEM